MPPKGFNIVERATWGARPPRARTPQNPRSVDELFFHWPGSSGSLRGINTTAEERRWMRDIQNFHMDTRGWSDFAYSYAIFLSGRIYRGRGFRNVPAGQEGHNTNTVAVVFVVGTADSVSSAMRETAREFTRWAERYARRELLVRGHGAVSQTSCPGPAITRLAAECNRV